MRKLFLLLLLPCLNLAFSQFMIARSEEGYSLIVHNSSPLALSVIKDGKESNVLVSKDIIKETEDIYVTVSLDDIDGDGADEIIMTHKSEGGVNSCSKAYRYDPVSNSIMEIIFSGADLCNYRKEEDYLISKYRDGSAWIEDIYKVDANSVRLIFTDSCLGCGVILRKEYKSKGDLKEYLVFDKENLSDRKPMFFKVLSRRAVIFESPDLSRPTMKYLVHGDKILITEISKIDGSAWVKFIFDGKITSRGWLKCSDLITCKTPNGQDLLH